MHGMKGELDREISLLKGKKTLEALQAVRECRRKVEELAEAQDPVPCSLRNSPLLPCGFVSASSAACRDTGDGFRLDRVSRARSAPRHAPKTPCPARHG